ncbi:MAG: CpsD/CapB family tyrosine-protein kinase [Verrucomicrobiae bacterium]|nr:CpsD/CapB family tyrosine-protein kinase [Verrucomicrobiae bacterium]
MAEPQADHGSVMSIAALIERIGERTPERGGYRSLVTGAADGTDGTATAIALARGLAEAGQPVILVEWTYGQSAVAKALSVPDHPGTAELIAGEASFEDVISGLPGTQCHVIAAGRQLTEAFAGQDPDQINLVLDALDEAYAHIVVTGEHGAVRHLFEAIQGRFDAGILVCGPEAGRAVRDPKERSSVLKSPKSISSISMRWRLPGSAVTEHRSATVHRPVRPDGLLRRGFCI